jgi:outer membrane cobalamin receptor
VDRLTVTAAWRLSHYSTVGWAGAWHAGLDYAPVAALRFRAMRSRAVRAPNIGELYSGPRRAMLSSPILRRD